MVPMNRPGHLLLLLVFMVSPAVYAAVPDDLLYTPPMQSSSMNGLMLNHLADTEFLTPIGIVDELPQQDIEPAAGPLEEPTDPSTTSISN